MEDSRGTNLFFYLRDEMQYLLLLIDVVNVSGWIWSSWRNDKMNWEEQYWKDQIKGVLSRSVKCVNHLEMDHKKEIEQSKDMNKRGVMLKPNQLFYYFLH